MKCLWCKQPIQQGPIDYIHTNGYYYCANYLLDTRMIATARDKGIFNFTAALGPPEDMIMKIGAK